MMLREPPLRLPTYLAASEGQPCTLQIPGVCRGDNSVPAHILDDHSGTGQKASDTSIADACVPCHAVFDGQATLPNGKHLSETEWMHYALKGLQRTLERRARRGVYPKIAPRKVQTTERKPRKKSGRKIRGRSTFAPKGTRKLSRRKENVT